MKKITFLLAFIAFGATAQTFPTPYCEIEVYYQVEELTSVDFNGTSMLNDDIDSVLLDYTSTVATVTPGQSYTITVQGNTYGEYENEYVAFIDWNQNGILDDDGEVHYIGLISDSDGNDSKNANVEIMVPDDAVLGQTRIRIIKTYTSVEFGFSLIIDPCAIISDVEGFGPEESYGQALDFTLNVSTLGVNSLDKNVLSTYPNPVKDVLNVKYISEIEKIEMYNVLGQQVLFKNIAQSDFKLDVSNFSTGTYIVKLFLKEGQHTFKLLKE